jgi:hypothetical protein
LVTLVVNRPVKTDSPTLQVDNQLRPGAHVFRLVVVDDSGRESRPDEITVTVQRAVPFAAPRAAPPPHRKRLP